jgi:hypothetical protein
MSRNGRLLRAASNASRPSAVLVTSCPAFANLLSSCGAHEATIFDYEDLNATGSPIRLMYITINRFCLGKTNA